MWGCDSSVTHHDYEKDTPVSAHTKIPNLRCAVLHLGYAHEVDVNSMVDKEGERQADQVANGKTQAGAAA